MSDRMFSSAAEMKLEPHALSPQQQPSLSATAVTVTSEDEDSDSRTTQTYRQRRREAHTFAEQKRRDAIKRGYDLLQELVPSCHAAESGGNNKMSKATVLQKSIDYTEFLLQQRRRQQDEFECLRKELVALQILKANYELLVKAHQNRPGPQDSQVSDDVKFQVFRAVVDRLFESFDVSVGASSFAELSGSMIAWMEEDVKPQVLRNICLEVLQHLNPTS